MAEFQSSRIDDAYLDRNLAVQLMALLFLKRDYKVGWLADNPNPEEGWDILMIELPGQGQISYHIRHEPSADR